MYTGCDQKAQLNSPYGNLCGQISINEGHHARMSPCKSDLFGKCCAAQRYAVWFLLLISMDMILKHSCKHSPW